MKKKFAHSVEAGDRISLPAALACDEVVVKSVRKITGPQGKMVCVQVEANTECWKGTAEFAFPGNFAVHYYPENKGRIRRFFGYLFAILLPFGQTRA